MKDTYNNCACLSFFCLWHAPGKAKLAPNFVWVLYRRKFGFITLTAINMFHFSTTATSKVRFYVMIAMAAVLVGCTARTETATHRSNTEKNTQAENKQASANTSANAGGPLIEIKPGSPAETVRVFYEKLREGKIREAIYLTNLRPAIEGLTEAELKEFSVDFDAVAKRVPARITINGEVISGDDATVMVKLPSEDNEGEFDDQQLHLKKKGEHWTIISADAEAEKKILAEGKNYFRNLKIDTHQEEAKKMLERLAKAQIAFSAENPGTFGEITRLIELGYLPADITSSESTGYNYELHLTDGRRNYYATATPAVYGKTGKNSYILVPSEKGPPVVSGRDNKGKPLQK